MLWKPVPSCVLTLSLAAVAAAVPPRVIDAKPNFGDVGVDPQLEAITLVFDQEMRVGSQSICGGGIEFPAIMGKGKWTDARTFVLPVKLVGGRRYVFSVNCPAALNFKSAKGEPATITPIAFKTAAAGEQAPTLTPEQADEAIKGLRTAIDERYSHRERLGLDWNQLFAAHDEAMRAARTPGALVRAMARLLAAAEDVHVAIAFDDLQLPAYQRLLSANEEPGAVLKLIPDLSTSSPRISLGRFDDGVGYIAINSWNAHGAEDLMKPAYAALEKFADAPGLIIDVPQNGGGDEAVAQAFASRFVEREKIYSRHRIRDPRAEGGWTASFDRIIKPAEGAALFAARVAVLIGPACVSSNESFVLMMQEPARRELFGTSTAGSSGNPHWYELVAGVKVLLPSWVNMDANGRPLEGAGIAPDHRVERPRGKVVDDPVIAAARAWLVPSAGGKVDPR